MISLIILITLYIVWGVISVRDLIKDINCPLRCTSAFLFFTLTFFLILLYLSINAGSYLSIL